jgi:predicted nucleic acid-binding protein
VRAVVSDTGPLHYLVLIEQIDIIPRLFTSIHIPPVVRAELDDPKTPLAVRQWLAIEPPWLIVQPVSPNTDPRLQSLDDGERDAITLATEIRAELLLMDDRAGVSVARARGFATTGTLGLLVMAAQRGLVDLPTAIGRLKSTNFRYQQEMLDRVIAGYRNNV